MDSESTPAPAAKSKNKALIPAIIGGVVLVAIIAVVIVFVAGNKTLSCEYKSSGGNSTTEVTVKYFFGNLSGVHMKSTTTFEEELSDEDFETYKKYSEPSESSHVINFSFKRDGKKAIVTEGDLDIEKAKADGDNEYTKDYDTVKASLEKDGMTCK